MNLRRVPSGLSMLVTAVYDRAEISFLYAFRIALKEASEEAWAGFTSGEDAVETLPELLFFTEWLGAASEGLFGETCAVSRDFDADGGSLDRRIKNRHNKNIAVTIAKEFLILDFVAGSSDF